VKIEFAKSDLQTVCESDKLLKKKYGKACTKKIQNRISDLRAAACVKDLTTGNPHPLTGNRMGQFSVCLTHGLCLLFECGISPIPKTNDGAIDWNKVTDVRITSIEDYHE
jgi:proteic killer suppression protein